jgi:hypothetical protein
MSQLSLEQEESRVYPRSYAVIADGVIRAL